MDSLETERRASINALMANGGYLQSKEGLQEREKIVRETNEYYEQIVQEILDPQPEVDLSENPFFAAGQAGMDKLRWEFKAGRIPGAAVAEGG